MFMLEATMPTYRNPAKRPLTFVNHLAMCVVRDSLKLSARSVAKRYVAFVVVPDEADIAIYEDATRRYLKGVLDTCRAKPSCYVASVAKACGGEALLGEELDHVVILVASVDRIEPDGMLAADNVVQLRRPEVSDFIEAAGLAYGKPLKALDAMVMKDASLGTLALAFPNGRSLPAGIRKLKQHTARIRQESEASPVELTPAAHEERTLEMLPGYGDAKSWGQRLAIDLADWKARRIGWADVDRGVVLAGPPGVGKTAFARALANSCAVKLVTSSAAKWQAKGHLGDALKAMRASFEEAKRNVPCILFIDELDSLPDRDADHGDNGSYYRQYVNGFLECLDGSDPREGVVVVGATNRVSNIDLAVLRPGRLERVIDIPLPDSVARRAILALNLPGPPLRLPDVFDVATENWSGAEIEQLARDVRRHSRRTSTPVSGELVTALLPQMTALDDALLYRVAVHEAGHAIVSILLAGRTVSSMTLRRHSYTAQNGDLSLGQVVIEEGTPRPRTRGWYEDRIAMAMSGIAAERLVFSDHADGGGGSHQSDLAVANHMATSLVAALGMDGSWLAEATLDQSALHTVKSRDRAIAARVDVIIETQFQRALECLSRHSVVLDRLATEFLSAGHLDGKDVRIIVSP